MHFPSWLQWYKKPSYTDIRVFGDKKALSDSTQSTPRSSIDSGSSRDVPSKLSLEKILKNQTCSPMSMYDFYMYLKHIEHSPENLEFFIWFKNYEAGRLTGNISRPQTMSSNGDNMDFGLPSMTQSNEKNSAYSDSQEFINLEHADMYAQISSLVDPSCRNSCRPNDRLSKVLRNKFNLNPPDEKNLDTDDVEVECRDLSTLVSDTEQARQIELQTIKSIFLVPGAPKELNIPCSMRTKVLEAISTSTSAANLKPVADHCYLLLKSCSHRNFIRLGVSNGTFETICMATSLGIVLVVGGLLAMLLLAFASPSINHGSRWRALGIWPMWATGVGLVLSGLRGSCFFLLLFSRRQPLPWEKFDDNNSVFAGKGGLIGFFGKLMIFDRKLTVKDDNLRGLQRKIVFQSLFGGMVFATLMEIFFLCLPIWKPIW